MRYIYVLLISFLVTACGGKNDMDLYIEQVKTRAPVPVEPLPELKPFSPMRYLQRDLRSPFISPQPEIAPDSEKKVNKTISCTQLVETREKEMLENYSLASLSMQGTLGKQGQLWALIRTPDGQSVRVGLNQHMGLDRGRVIKISSASINLLEVIPDGKGCWVTRETQLGMTESKEKR
ncbi:pilus assembly protein PilP [Aeromonas cavernicola]|uniref:Pilus assembly protein PilP n=1 Tax=Aeromonas cavernicola TaxID=1006623 RepID=A0A2H9U9M0_9GAMM|nr:pilus assembly protein PilP [Aeromonas cavernicola]PJG60723.1 pilus assembly protein PilP [Aeromonas cavernicola]